MYDVVFVFMKFFFFKVFGVGVLEEDDEDIYLRDYLFNYDMTMDIEEDIYMGWIVLGRGKK